MSVSKEEMFRIRSENLRKARIKAREFHQSEEGKKIRKERARKRHDEKVAVQKTCECCGKEYFSKSIVLQKYCSGKCKSQFRRDKKLDGIEVVCVVCKKKFYM